MSAVIQNEYTGNNSTTTYSFTFPYLKTSDIKASLDGVDTTAFTLPNATTLQFNTAPGSGVKIKIFRQTSVDDLTATFYAGSAIKSEDLNDNFTQNLYKTQEVGARFVSNLGGTMTGDLTMGEDTVIKFEGATDDAHETTLTVADPTADRTITLPNVTGTVVTTGDTGTVATAMIADNAITVAKIANGQVTTDKLNNSAVTEAKLANNAVTVNKIADGQVTTAKLNVDAVTNAKLADNAVDANQIVANAVTTAKINDDAVTNAKLANNSVDVSQLVSSAVTTVKINNDAVTQAKMADDSVGTAQLIDGSVDSDRLASNSVTLAKMADNSVGTSELVNNAVTTVKIADDAVLTAKIASGAITESRLGTDSVTNAKIANNAVSTNEIADNAVTTAKINGLAVTEGKIASNAVTTAKIANDAVSTAKIADSELKTLAGMQSGTASKLADSTALTADIADLNQIDGLTKQTTISDSDASFPTSGAVVDYVAAQIAPLGGLEVIATEVAFPNTQPASGVVISISDAGGVVFNGSGVSTTGRTIGGTTVTINGAPSSLHGETLVAGVGLMVSSTGTSSGGSPVYAYHKILGKEDDIKQLSDDINDFNARYRVGSSNPTSALDAGDLFFNTSTSKLLVYNATNTAWEEAQSIGNFFISTLSPAFNGSLQDFTITNAPANAQQILLSINGVVQKPNSGTSTPSEGFALSGSTVKLSAPPASGSDYFAIVLGSTVNIGTPSNNTVSSSVLQNSAVTTAKIADEAVTLAKLEHGTSSNNGKFLRANNGADPTFESVITDLVNDTSPQLGGDLDTNSHHILLDDTHSVRFGASADLEIYHDGSSNNTYITNDTGDLFINNVGTNSDDIVIKAKDDIFLQPDNGDNGVNVIGNGAVELYYDNSKKLETTSYGARVFGNLENHNGFITVKDAGKFTVGNSDDLQLYHNGTNSIISNATNKLMIQNTNANIQFEAKNGEDSCKMIPDGAVELYYDNAKKFETQSIGITVTGQVACDELKMVDSTGVGNNRIKLGAGDDFQMYHNGSTNIIDGTNTNIDIQASGAINIKPANAAGITAFNNGAVELYHSANKKLETTSEGILLSGTLENRAFDNTGGNGGRHTTGFIFGNAYDAGKGSVSGVTDDRNSIIWNERGLDIVFATSNTPRCVVNYDGHFVPIANNTYDLGSTGTRWRNIYTNDLHLSNEGSSNDVDSTWGDWTIQEGESDLFLKNNRSGKKYKFNLTEVL